MSIAIKRPLPGYLILKPYELKREIGGWSVAQESEEDAPEIGEVLMVGEEITKMPYDYKLVPQKGSIVAYKRYNHFKFELGDAERVFAVSFENILFEVEEK